MIDIPKFYSSLKNAGVEFVTGVPDTLLNDFCSFAADKLPEDKHVITANEGNAVALAAGYHLATGTVPLIYMQNSGLGNAVNPLVSLVNEEVYAIPMVLLVGWRGDPDRADHAHHVKQGQLTPALLQAMCIPYKILHDDTEAVSDCIRWAVGKAKEISSPTALIVKKGILAKEKKIIEENCKTGLISRENAIESVLNFIPKNSICIATTGRATRELYYLREKYGFEHNHDFLNVGAMGHASSIAEGIALAKPDRLVVCFDGDAAAIMHMGSMATIGSSGLKNYLHIVLNNGSHESVGGQPSAALKVNLSSIAENAGYRTVGKSVKSKEELGRAVNELLSVEGSIFIDIRIRKGIRLDLPPLKVSHKQLKQDLMQELRS